MFQHHHGILYHWSIEFLDLPLRRRHCRSTASAEWEFAAFSQEPFVDFEQRFTSFLGFVFRHGVDLSLFLLLAVVGPPHHVGELLGSFLIAISPFDYIFFLDSCSFSQVKALSR